MQAHVESDSSWEEYVLAAIAGIGGIVVGASPGIGVGSALILMIVCGCLCMSACLLGELSGAYPPLSATLQCVNGLVSTHVQRCRSVQLLPGTSSFGINMIQVRHAQLCTKNNAMAWIWCLFSSA